MFALGGAKQRQFADRALRRGHDSGEQLREMARHAFNRRCGEQVGVVLEAGVQAAIGLVDVQQQIEFGRRTVCSDR